VKERERRGRQMKGEGGRERGGDPRATTSSVLRCEGEREREGTT
jgi:hypothetical protein